MDFSRERGAEVGGGLDLGRERGPEVGGGLDLGRERGAKIGGGLDLGLEREAKIGSDLEQIKGKEPLNGPFAFRVFPRPMPSRARGIFCGFLTRSSSTMSRGRTNGKSPVWV